MGRSNRCDRADAWHHVVNRGAGGQTVFARGADGAAFLRLLAVASERFGVEVHAYCLMTNHYHLLLRCPDGGLSAFMQYVTSIYTRHANEALGRDGPLFRGRFRSLVFDTEEHLLDSVRYIHRNPVDRGAAIDTYRWSSHAEYLGLRPRPAWLTTDVVLARFGEGVTGFERFVADQRGRPDDSLLERRIRLLIAELGDDLEVAPQGLVKTLLALAGAPAVTAAECAAARRARARLAVEPVVAQLLARLQFAR